MSKKATKKDLEKWCVAIPAYEILWDEDMPDIWVWTKLVADIAGEYTADIEG